MREFIDYLLSVSVVLVLVFGFWAVGEKIEARLHEQVNERLNEELGPLRTEVQVLRARITQMEEQHG